MTFALQSISNFGSPRAGYNGGPIGTKIYVGDADIAVTQLGFWNISGNVNPHTVSIIAADGTTVVASVSIATSGQPSGLLYGAVSCTLSNNTLYFIVADFTDLEQCLDNPSMSTIYQTRFTTMGAYYSPSSGTWNNFDSGLHKSFVGIDFQYTETPITPNPLRAVVSQTLTVLRADFNQYLGIDFTVVAVDLIVSELGFWNVKGNTASHDVTIFDSTGSSVIASATINATGLDDGWVYAAITPVTLTAGATYRFAGKHYADAWWDNGDTSIVASSDITFGTNYYYTGSWNSFLSYPKMYGPIDFRYALTGSSAKPWVYAANALRQMKGSA